MKKPLILAALVAAVAPISLSAADVYWDGNSIDPGAGDTPGGSWTGSGFWSTDPLGEMPTGPWTNGDTAIFSAGMDAVTAFTVTGSGTSTSPGATAAGVVIEEGTVTFSGGTLGIGAGTITIKAGAKLSTDSSLRIQATVGAVFTLDGGTLRTTNGGANGSFIDNDATIFLEAAGGTIEYTVPNVLNIINFVSPNPGTTISGPGSLTKSGVGVIAIATACTYLGPTFVNEGELRIRTSANRLPITTDVTVNLPGILNLNNVGQQIGSLSGNGDVGTGGATLTINGSADTTFNGAIKNIANAGAGAVTTGNGSLTKAGSGIITFTGGNDITGTVTLNAGGINVESTASLCGLANLTVNGGTLNLNNAAQTIKALAGAGGTINLSTGHILTSDPASSTAYSGTIAGEGGLTRLNTDATNRILTLSGPNTYNGITTVNKGVIAVGSVTALGSTTGDTEVTSGGEIRFDGAGINFTVNEAFRIAGPGSGGGGAITIQNLSNPTLSGPITLTGNATVTVSSTATGTFNNANAFTSLANESLTLQGGSGAGGGGTISGVIALGTGGLTKLQGGRWILTAANTYSGTTTIGAGTLQLGNGLDGGDGTISNSPNIVNNGNLTFNRFGSVTYAGPITGTGSVTKTGAGTQTLSGTNAYSGSTNVSNGMLKLGATGTLGYGGLQTISTASTTVSGGATLDLNGAGAINEPILLNGAGVGGIGALINGSATLALIDDGIAGAQVPAITGTGSGYSTAPTVMFSGTGSGATATATLGVTAASFTINPGDKDYTAAPSVTISGGGGTGATAVAVLSGGTTGTVTGITITNAGTGYTTAPTIAFGAGTSSSGTINASGTGNATEFTVSGLNMTAPGSGYTGTPTYTFGSGNATPGTVTLSSVTLASNSSIGGSGDIEIDSAISQIGIDKVLTKGGTGKLIIDGPQSYSGLQIDAGTVTLNSSLADATITNEGGTLNLNADATNSTINANSAAGTNIHVDQTLTALNIGAGGVVVLGGGPPPAPAAEEPALAMSAEGAPVVPEPGSVSLLMLGALGFLLRRRRKDAQA
jgi:autotransporter-associated beta strand protein